MFRINEEIICTLSEIKPLTYPVLSRSTLGVDLVTLSNPVVLGLCFLSENSLSPLVSYLYVWSILYGELLGTFIPNIYCTVSDVSQFCYQDEIFKEIFFKEYRKGSPNTLFILVFYFSWEHNTSTCTYDQCVHIVHVIRQLY